MRIVRLVRAAPRSASPHNDQASIAPPPPPLGGSVTVRDTDDRGGGARRVDACQGIHVVPAAAGVTVCLPLLASAPLQLPEAVQPVVLTEDQAIVVELPAAMEVTPSVKVGTPGAMSASAASA